MSATVKIFTDGSCLGNPGPGGWAYVIVTPGIPEEQLIAEDSGAEADTTNNRMELMAVINALRCYRALGRMPKQASVCTDSRYVQMGITSWIRKWKNNGWRTTDKKPVKNQDLWVELDALAIETAPAWQWVEGHAGNIWNERCDQMAQAAAKLPAAP